MTPPEKMRYASSSDSLAGLSPLCGGTLAACEINLPSDSHSGSPGGVSPLCGGLGGTLAASCEVNLPSSMLLRSAQESTRGLHPLVIRSASYKNRKTLPLRTPAPGATSLSPLDNVMSTVNVRDCATARALSTPSSSPDGTAATASSLLDSDLRS